VIGAAYECLHQTLLPLLNEEGLEIPMYESLAKQERAMLETYFHKAVFPVLTPLAFDPGRPFPHISSLSMNIAVAVRNDERAEHFARVKVPESIPKLIAAHASDELPAARMRFVWLEQLIAAIW